jgi:outer membrane protein assembly factor BamB
VCRSLSDGKEIWRYKEQRVIRPNHAITRTVPAVDATSVFRSTRSVCCMSWTSKTGKEKWRKDLVAEYKTMIPPWYNGQNPLPGTHPVIIATGGDAILVALDKATAGAVWRTPNPDKLLLSHVSVMPAVLVWGQAISVRARLMASARRYPLRTANCFGSSRASSTWSSRHRRSPSTKSVSL